MPPAGEILRLTGKTLAFFGHIIAINIGFKIRAIIHSYTYKAKPVAECRTVVVVGGSFAGIEVVRRLCQSLPTGWRVVLVEPNSHLHHLFAFPRFSVIPGHEHKAFIPYDMLQKAGPEGIFEQVQGLVTEITESEVRLADGKAVPYDYLVMATGTYQAPPSHLHATEKAAGCAELRDLQDKVKNARSIAVVGGGPVGVEVSTDIKSWYPEKEVTLIHSRAQLLNHFGKRLNDASLEPIKKIGVKLMLEQRPEIISAGVGGTLKFADGHESTYDYIIPATGQKPNSLLIENYSPEAVAKDTKEILVKPTLQVMCGDGKGPQNIYAVGDVARTGGSKMARAAFFQAAVAQYNIIARIINKPERNYVPNDVEGSIKLTLGKETSLMYIPDSKGKDILLTVGGTPEDMEVKKVWGMMGAKWDPQEA